jgi:hypothetical protein
MGMNAQELSHRHHDTGYVEWSLGRGRCQLFAWLHGAGAVHRPGKPTPVKCTTPLAAACLLAALLIGGCSQNNTPSPGTIRPPRVAKWIHRFESPSTSYQSKLRIDRRLQNCLGPKSPARLAALVFDIGCYGQSSRTKIYCLTQLWSGQRNLAAQVIIHRLPLTDHWPMLKAEIRLAVQMRSPAMRSRIVSALIQSLARKSHRYALAVRPEARALRFMCQASLWHILTDALAHGKNMATRVAAMHVINRWRGRHALLHWLQRYRGTDPLMHNLHRYACNFSFAPRTATEMLWVQQCCHSRPTGSFKADRNIFQTIKCWQPAVSPLQLLWLKRLRLQYGGSLPTLAKLRHRTIVAGRQHRHIKRPPWYTGAPDDVHSAVRHSVPGLPYLDLCLLRYLQNALSTEKFDREIWLRGRRAARHRQSEPGGLIMPAMSGRLPPSQANRPATPYLLFVPSAINEGPGIYVSGPGIFEGAPHAISQFIYHFQTVDNARYCGPAIGDLQYARHNASVVVIFTSIARRQFDVTVDFPSGAVVDLGVYHVHRASEGLPA